MISIIFLLPQLIYSIKRALKLQGKTGNAAFCAFCDHLIAHVLHDHYNTVIKQCCLFVTADAA